MASLIRWFLNNRVAANLLMVALLATGIVSALTVTVRTFPEIATNAVAVTVAYPGATPSEVADGILIPIEERLTGLEGVRKLLGTARSGVGTMTAELTRGATLETVKTDIETEIARITTFPRGAEKPRIAEVEPTELAVEIALHGEVGVMTLKALAERVRRDLTALPEVSQVSLLGVPDDMIAITVDRGTLQSYGLGLTGLATRLSEQLIDLSGGSIDTGRSDIQIRTEGDAETAETLRDIPLFASDSGSQVRLGDIADVRATLDDGDARAAVSGENAVFVSVNRAGSEQVLAVADATRAYLDTTLRPSLPPGVTATVWRNEADVLRGRIDLLTKNGLIGAALVLIVLALFLDLRVAAWVALGVGVAFVAAFGPMLLFGTTINQLSLFGFILALGIVVDDAIVVGENTFSELQGTDDPEGAAEHGVLRVWRPVMFSVSTTICAFFPLLFLPGSSGSFLQPVAAVVIFVLVASLVESWFVLPRHLQGIRLAAPHRWSPRRLTDLLRNRTGHAFDGFRDGPLRSVVSGAVRHPFFTIALCVAIAIASFGLLSGGIVRFVFFPAIEGNFVTARLDLPEGTSPDETRDRAARFLTAAQQAAGAVGEKGLLQATAVTVGFSTGGGPGEGAGNTAGSSAVIEAKLLDASLRETPAETFKKAWRDAVGEIAGAREVIYSASVVGLGAAITLRISADNAAAREAATRQLRDALAERPGTFDIRDDRASAAREVILSPRPAARIYGVSTETIAREVRAAFYGVVIDQFARAREEVDIRLRLPPGERDSFADLERVRIPTSSGLVPLPSVAELSFRPAATEITRIDGRAVVTLRGDVNTALTTGADETAYLMQSVVPELRRDYPGLRVEAGGEQEEQGRFGPALAFNFLLAVFAMYTLLALAFRSYTRPFIVLAVIPFGFIGALLGHVMMGLDLTILSLFGVIGLSGVIVNAALLIVDFIAAREARGEESGDAIVEATLSRFRPIVLTTLTTFLGIAPLVLETSVQAQFLIPTAVSLGMGVLFASALQMVLVPAFAAAGLHLRGALTSHASP